MNFGETWHTQESFTNNEAFSWKISIIDRGAAETNATEVVSFLATRMMMMGLR
jgi:hypothetical protein